jgi:hypothetical protein
MASREEAIGSTGGGAYDLGAVANENNSIREELTATSTEEEQRRQNGFVSRVVSPVANVGKGTVRVINDNVLPSLELNMKWYHFIALTFFVAIPAAFYILVFTKMGYGLDSFYYLSKYFEVHSFKLGAALGGFAFVLYLLDVYYWEDRCLKFFRMLFISIIVIGLFVLICFIATTYPYGPICMWIATTPIWFMIIRGLFFRKVDVRTYFSWLTLPLLLNSVIVFTLWVVWTYDRPENKWNASIRLRDAEMTGCEADASVEGGICVDEDTGAVCFSSQDNGPVWTDACPEKCAAVYDECFNQFIIWGGPCLVSIGLFCLSFFTSFVKKEDSLEKEFAKFGKIYALLLMVLWIAASLTGAGAGLTTTLSALTLSAFVASAIFIAVSQGKAQDREDWVKVRLETILNKYETYLDIGKGLLVVTCLPVAIVYLAVSFIVQTIRKMGCTARCTSPNLRNGEVEGCGNAQFLTVEALNLIKQFRSWNLAIVYTYAIYWGAVFITFTVLAAKFTILFLSWLIEETKALDIASVTGIIFGVGVIMFLLPPVPGAPIYLTLGIVIVPVGRETFGLVWCIVYAMGISLLLKLFATFLQQKMIGGLLQNSLSVRQMVGINTKLIRAMKLCLEEPGLGISKVSILCGGPDWPTSVLCGIMGLPLFPILVGTLPVALLVVPTVLAGSFTYMSSLKISESGELEFPWATTAATMATAASGLVLLGFALSATYYLEQTMKSREQDLEKLAYDEEVKKANEEEIAINNAYSEVVEWSSLPTFPQLLLIISLACMITSCYITQLFQEDAFAEYELTYTIEDHLEGDWKNLVKPIGLVSIVLFGASLLLLFMFRTWAMSKARRVLKENPDRYTNREEQIEAPVPQDDEKYDMDPNDDDISYNVALAATGTICGFEVSQIKMPLKASEST